MATLPRDRNSQSIQAFAPNRIINTTLEVGNGYEYEMEAGGANNPRVISVLADKQVTMTIKGVDGSGYFPIPANTYLQIGIDRRNLIFNSSETANLYIMVM